MLSAAERIAKLTISNPIRKLILLGIALGTDIDGLCREARLAYDLAELPHEETYWHIVELCCEELCEIVADAELEEMPAYRLLWANLEARYPYRLPPWSANK
jgi:hypothetical protein